MEELFKIMESFWPDLTRSHLRLAIGLAILFSLAGAAIWQLALPLHFWPFRLLDRVGGVARALGVLGLLAAALIVTLNLIHRTLLKPLHDLLEYVANQHDNPMCDPPAALLERTDDIGWLTDEIRGLVAKLKDQNDALLAKTLNDPLTRLGNRRLLEQRLDIALPMSRRLGVPISALMIDVDHFKSYNDYYGHPTGDTCLLEIANVLRDTFRRETDILVRLGGEEFLVILFDADAGGSLQMAEAMRNMLQLVAIPHAKSPTAPVVTVSIGVATVEPGTVVDVAALIACADSALYQCKTKGRNRSFHHAIGDKSGALPHDPRNQDMADNVFRSTR